VFAVVDFCVLGSMTISRALSKKLAVVGLGLVLLGIWVWGVGKKVPAFPEEYRGVWRDERGVGVEIGPGEIQWTNVKGIPTKLWKCERFHAWPGGISFSLEGNEERMCIEWNAWGSRIQFGYWEDEETGPNTSTMRWTPQSWELSRVR